MPTALSLHSLIVCTRLGRLRFARHWTPGTAAALSQDVLGSHSPSRSLPSGPPPAAGRNRTRGGPVDTPSGVAPTLHNSAFEQSLIAACLAQASDTTDQGSVPTGRFKAVHKRYGNLIFISVCDPAENTFAVLSFTHCLVETLSRYFDGFSEYHLVFNMEKVHLVLDEMVAGGYVVETVRENVLPVFAQMERQVSLA
ncbi:clathrin adaptor complex small chain-domain-containing protein [Entophlyctis helioformis]|nr:clathrin adaptor complex small chain-domain-containing protein [Entophlyctis helioformis]